MTAHESKKTMRLPFNMKEVLKISVSSIIMGAVVYMMNASDILSILIAVVIGVIVYFVCIFIFKGISKKEIEIFKGLIQ